MEWLPDPKKAYHYIRIRPRRPADKAEFTEARLSLAAADSLPRQLTYIQPNGNVTQWDFAELQPKAADAHFAPPRSLPPDWRVETTAPR